MALQLGLFSDFKGRDFLLLTGDAAAFIRLLPELDAASRGGQFRIHEISVRLPTCSIELVAASQPVPAPAFTWLCDPTTVVSIRTDLQALTQCTSGHQYFDLAGSRVQLMVSLGEYDAAWWQHGPNNKLQRTRGGSFGEQ